MDITDRKHHISQQFNRELEEVTTKLAEMGGLAQRQINDALKALIDADPELAKRVVEEDEKVNDMEVEIDDDCIHIIARRQPAAGDLRLVIAITKAITDLERVGDEASKIARQAISLGREGSAPKGYVEVRHIGGQVSRMLHDALDAFARLDLDMAMRVIETDETVDMEYNTAMREMISFMIEDPRSISRALNILWSLRALERVGDHARNLAQYVVYLVRGEDVRHDSYDDIQEQIQDEGTV